jgi:hypothetical protein
MKKFIITEEEKNRIIGMHKTATSKHYLMEQVTGDTQTNVGPYDECFTSQGIPQEKIPQSCKSKETYGPCASEMMKGEFYKTTDMMDKVDLALNCMSEKLRG